MPLFYTRQESESEIKIVYTNQALVYIFLLIIFGLTFLDLSFDWQLILFFFTLSFIIVWYAGLWKTGREVRQAMKTGKVIVSGSKLSFKNPVTVVIKK
ncbi:hypothetical protein A2533_01985 [Candidatus Falkowbacteria bacterium RIFOXYD2_FULL_35_9]|uniref:Uncharacterized protein n=1 Tax=Candidatus Falkowbacteria bacterium RIFOXYC2_FULL_36_12 TaxID=1798002 RepID=A0A1F5SY21_9BACT|nr:MAG: hypothetical protein A2300_00845 [Candidatus Falkowbacteria bacterium RIFOXYB2_FULL_35_7]OGF31617.1 MAG: hypothetical protein A2478_03975 [Candidatus Falkowbacteria bacterium RIFOXYC2_FULL_36_12]OGF33913.1 MAG: hypothetical protein A2223_02985 [Candidatus Falkowbacteria bacterium RIFOXYA2_FULL_35_8]OGF46886.1 MAG: hypothetical protein A2533_01985 [Candidatus Falkowbacteria bacterium RIFOXYD2_FULL_35_9]